MQPGFINYKVEKIPGEFAAIDKHRPIHIPGGTEVTIANLNNSNRYVIKKNTTALTQGRVWHSLSPVFCNVILDGKTYMIKTGPHNIVVLPGVCFLA